MAEQRFIGIALVATTNAMPVAVAASVAASRRRHASRRRWRHRATPARGRALIVARESANCVLCHAVPDAAVRFAGNLGPPLAGIGQRLTVAQLRLRVADNLRVNPASVMPSYYKIEGLDRVATAYAGKPILSAQELEDVVA